MVSPLCIAQQTTPPSTSDPAAQSAPSAPSATQNEPNSPAKPGANGESVPVSKQQPKRILGIMPNYRAVSAGAIPPPPTPKQAFLIATQNSFDYSSFIFVGITSALAEGTDAHPQLGKGMPGFGRYYWRGFLDKTDGNYLVIFALPSVFHQDERYYAKGEGEFFKRGIYAASRILITPDYHGKNSFNASEVFGRAMAQGVSLSYYPATIAPSVLLPSSTDGPWGVTHLPMCFENSGLTSLRTYCTGIPRPVGLGLRRGVLVRL